MRVGWSALVVLAGCGRLGFDAGGSFVDEGAATFDLGTYDEGPMRLAYSGGVVRFADPPPYASGATGTFVSREFRAASAGTVWDTLAWRPLAPSHRPLPDDGGRDSGYLEGGVDMAGATLLLHFDDTASLAAGAKVTDRSGKLHDGEVVLAGQAINHVTSEFAQGVAIDRDAWVRLDGNDFDYGTADFTYAIWVKMFDCSQSNDNRIALGGAGAGDTPHMWIGALCPDACPDGDGAFMNFLDSSRNGPSLSPCTTIRLDDGAWHHLAGVKQGHSNPAATVRLYVDGREVANDTYDFGTNTFDYDGGELRIGSFNLNDPTYHTRITVDEAAIWQRALSATEIQALYRRGAVQLELQIRACPDGACDDEPFVGPDGTGATVFTEADLSGPAGSQRSNLAGLGLVGAVAQYRARFTTFAAETSPGLERVELMPAR